MKIIIIEHSGEVHTTEVDNYNVQEIFTQLKEAQNSETNDHVVLIGEVIIDSRSVKTVSLVKE
ncbi:hypothetical protein [Metabacillus halosaccharovorans]|uniref:hypothetical protein n=1 Tax=Metabacillus halosaccharovorans TaxID=930124 RepID=UPI0009958D51|nr:hypothetical protein [Metabacillus halosaccharovorans]